MKCMRFLALVAGVVALALFVACSGGAKKPKHLVLITVDTLRADHLVAYGGVRPTSDAANAAARGSAAGYTLDELAASGTRFAHAYTPRGETFPALCALFAGAPPPETGVLGNRETLTADVTTLAEHLRSSGFRTAAFTTNKLLDKGSGIEQGFETFETDFGEERDANVLARAAAYVREHAQGEHVFVWVHLMGPHLPYDPRPSNGVDFARLFADPTYTGPANGSRAFVDAAYTEQRALSDADVRAIVAQYDGEVARVDQLVSRFVKALDEKRREGPTFLDDALFVFTADHGEELHERAGYFGHSKSVSSAVLHVPLFIRWPGGVRARVEENAIVGLEDLAPTILASFGLPSRAEHRGLDLGALLRGESDARFDPAKRCAIGLWRFDIFSVTDGRWRLVLNRDRLEPQEIPPGPYPVPELALYDRRADPSELVDVAAAHPAEASRLQGALDAWIKSLRPRTNAGGPLSPERMKALIHEGYAGGER